MPRPARARSALFIRRAAGETTLHTRALSPPPPGSAGDYPAARGLSAVVAAERLADSARGLSDFARTSGMGVLLFEKRVSLVIPVRLLRYQVAVTQPRICKRFYLKT